MTTQHVAVEREFGVRAIISHMHRAAMAGDLVAQLMQGLAAAVENSGQKITTSSIHRTQVGHADLVAWPFVTVDIR